MTQQLLTAEYFFGAILEPAAGNGAIARVLAQRFFNVEFYDKERDFLIEEGSYPCIITNPPFSLAKEFIQQCKKVATYKFALLLPLSYLHGKERYDLGLFRNSDYNLRRIHVFTRYPMLGDPLREDGKYRTGMMVYAWYIWEQGYTGEATIHWIDNQPFILNKSDMD